MVAWLTGPILSVGTKVFYHTAGQDNDDTAERLFFELAHVQRLIILCTQC